MPKPKTIYVSLKEIVKDIDQATEKLSAAKTKAVSGKEKQRLAAKIKSLKKIKKEVQAVCYQAAQTKLPYGIGVPVN